MVNQVIQKPVAPAVKPVVSKPVAAKTAVAPTTQPVAVVGEEKPSIWKKWWLWTIVVLVIAGLISWIVFW